MWLHKRLNNITQSFIPLLVLCLLGCGKDGTPELPEIPKPADVIKQVQKTVDNSVENVKKQIQVAGSFELNLGAIRKINGCYATFVPSLEGRSPMLRISNYNDSNNEGFPSVMIVAYFNQPDVMSMVNQPCPASMFVQLSSDGEVYHSEVAKPISVVIKETDGTAIVGEITSGALTNTSTGQSITVRGKFSGFIQ